MCRTAARIMSSAILLVVITTMVTLIQGETSVERIYKNEESEEGTEIADLPLIFGLTWSERRTRSFKLLSQKLVTMEPESSKTGTDWVRLFPDTGVINLARRVDREAMCGSAKKCIIQMQVVMLPQHHFTLLNIELTIVDTNDHSPEFSGKDKSVNISEGVSPGDVINIDYLQAQDLDIGENSDISYKLSPNDYFEVDQSIDEAGTRHLQLVVVKKPDYEMLSSISLKLTGRDGGSPSRSNDLTVEINIEDENDNAPTFELQEYVCDITESAVPGSIIATVVATDADDGIYGRVRYFLPNPSITDKSTALARQLLRVNEVTGDVILKEHPKRNIHDGSRVLIEARDMDPEKSRIGKTWLLLNVEDVNDNDPTISVNYIVEAINNTALIPESQGRGDYIAYVSATDVDNGRNGDVTSSIRTKKINGEPLDSQMDQLSPHFVLEKDSLIGIGKNLDRENINSYVVTITACDNGQPPRCIDLDINIVVLDVNDHAPKFPAKTASVNVIENSAPGITLKRFVAVDEDEMNPPGMVLEHGKPVRSNYGKVIYSIVKGNKDLFKINENNGDLILLQPLDFESSEVWELIINAKDGAKNNARTTNCTVRVNVIDANDNPPMFVNPSRNDTRVYATTLKDQLIIKLKAKDSDRGENSKLLYEITAEDGIKVIPNKPYKSIFLLHPTHGDLRLNFSNPNISQTLGPHKLVIMVTDSGSYPLTKSVRLTVDVTDQHVADPVAFGEIDVKIIAMIIIISLVFIALMIVVACALLKCHKREKNARTYNCRNAESKASKVWITTETDDNVYNANIATTDRWPQGGADKLRVSSRANSRHDNNRNEYSMGHETQQRSTPKQTAINQASLSTFSYDGRKIDGSLGVPAITPSTVDRDSGRGDSDPEMTHDHIESKNKEDANRSSVSTDLAPRCSSACLQHGHSDSCWMPSPTREAHSVGHPTLSYSRSSMASQQPDAYNTTEYQSYPTYTSGDYPTYNEEIPDYPPPPSLHDMQFNNFHGYNNNLGPILENGDQVQYSNEYDVSEEDDVSMHTQMVLSTDVIPGMYVGSQSHLNVLPMNNASMSYHEPPHIQRTALSPVYASNQKPPSYARASSRLSSCSSNNSAAYRPHNVPHHNLHHRGYPYIPQSHLHNTNSNNNSPEASTLPRLHQEDVPLIENRKYASTDRLMEAPNMSPLETYYPDENRQTHVQDSGQVTMEEARDILKSIDQLLEN